MTYFQSTLFIIFGIILYMMVVDKNVAQFIDLISKLFQNEITKRIWMIKNHPRNPITNLIKRREYDKIAEELMKEFDNKR